MPANRWDAGLRISPPSASTTCPSPAGGSIAVRASLKLAAKTRSAATARPMTSRRRLGPGHGCRFRCCCRCRGSGRGSVTRGRHRLLTPSPSTRRTSRTTRTTRTIPTIPANATRPATATTARPPASEPLAAANRSAAVRHSTVPARSAAWSIAQDGCRVRNATHWPAKAAMASGSTRAHGAVPRGDMPKVYSDSLPVLNDIGVTSE